MARKIIVKNISIALISRIDEDYISLTDMAKFKKYDSGVVLSNWLTTKYTVQFMGAWEQLHNPNFNPMEFHRIKIWIMQLLPSTHELNSIFCGQPI